MTVDGFGFGTLTGESCLKNVHCHTDRASWDAILVTVVAFGALMWKTSAQSHRFGLGRMGGGGGYHWGGGGVGEPRTGIIYIHGVFRPALVWPKEETEGEDVAIKLEPLKARRATAAV